MMLLTMPMAALILLMVFAGELLANVMVGGGRGCPLSLERVLLGV